MLEKLFSSFRQPAADSDDGTRPLEAAVAALLVEAARADQDYTDEERALIDDMLCRRFGVTADDAAAIRGRAELAQAEANDLYGFSRVVKEEMDREAKLSLLEDLWVIALSDADKAPYEEMIIRRLIGLIHLEDTDSAAARQRAALRLEQEGVPNGQ